MRATLALAIALSFSSLTPQQSTTVNRLEHKLMAPCCYSQTIAEHMSSEAAQMRDEVTAMVAAGKSEQEIISYYKTKYGETIVVTPDGVSGKIAFGVPVLVFALASLLLAFVLRRGTRARYGTASSTLPAASASDHSDVIRRIRSELGDY